MVAFYFKPETVKMVLEAPEGIAWQGSREHGRQAESRASMNDSYGGGGCFLADFGERKTKKNTFFEKRTGEVAENKGSVSKNEPKRTEKRSGEVVENT